MEGTFKEKNMKQFIKRLLKEEKELKIKTNKLKEIIDNGMYKTIPSVRQQELLLEQYNLMCKYLEILNKRIFIIENENY